PLGDRARRTGTRLLDRGAHGRARPRQGAPAAARRGSAAIARAGPSGPRRVTTAVARVQVLPDQSHARAAGAGAARAARAPSGDPPARCRLRPLVPDAPDRLV